MEALVRELGFTLGIIFSSVIISLLFSLFCSFFMYKLKHLNFKNIFSLIWPLTLGYHLGYSYVKYIINMENIEFFPISNPILAFLIGASIFTSFAYYPFFIKKKKLTMKISYVIVQFLLLFAIKILIDYKYLFL